MPRRKPLSHEALGLTWRTGVTSPTRRTCWIEGRCRPTHHGAPTALPSGVVILIEESSGIACATRTLGGDGRFRFEVPTGTYRIILDAPHVNGCGDSTTAFHC